MNYLNDLIGFVFLMYLLSAFNYIPNYGSLFIILAFPVLMLNSKQFLGNILRTDNILLLLLLLMNFIGLGLRNTGTPIEKVIGAATIMVYVFIHLAAKEVKFDKSTIGLFVKFTLINMIFVFATFLNMALGFIKFNSPILGGQAFWGTEFWAACIGSSPIVADYSVFNFIIAHNFLKAGTYRRQSFIIIILSFLSIIIAKSRGPVLMMVIYLGISFLFEPKIKRRVNELSGLSIIIVLILAILIFAPNIFDIGKVIQRFNTKEVQIRAITIEGIISGRDTNRDTAFEIAINRLKEDPPFIGYGWSTHENNAYAWFGSRRFYRQDPHNGLFTLLPIFGYFGTCLLIIYMMITIYKLLRIRYIEDELDALRRGLSWALIFFIIGQYKMGAAASENYFMLFWIWFGFASAVSNRKLQTIVVK